MWGDKCYHSLDYEIKARYGEKLYKLSLDGGFTCPNRDGRIGRGGCIFCSAGGSGDFTPDDRLSVTEQIEAAAALVAKKHRGHGYIAYFQAYTGTYGAPDRLRRLYMEATSRPDVRILSIATRPDCLEPPILSVLSDMAAIKPVWIELGLQTIHASTAEYIRRGYPLPVFEKAVHTLHAMGIEVIVHVILGLPGESREDMLATIRYLNTLPISGIKLQLLHVLKGTDLAADYAAGKFKTLTLEEYTDLLIECIEALRPDITIHRITGDGPKKLLIAPAWSADKKKVLGRIHHEMKLRGSLQGRCFEENTEHRTMDSDHC